MNLGHLCQQQCAQLRVNENWLGILKKQTRYTGFPDIVGKWPLELMVDDAIVVAVVLAALVVLTVDMVVEIGVPLEA